MNTQALFRAAIGWAATYGEGRHSISIEDWDRIADSKAKEFAARAIPAGFVLVPMEPTVEMKIAGDNAGFWCADKYRAMLAAAPKQEQQP